MPLLMGMVLGPMLENSFRRALMVSPGDLSVIYTRPLSLTFLIMTALLIIMAAVPKIARTRQVVLAEG